MEQTRAAAEVEWDPFPFTFFLFLLDNSNLVILSFVRHEFELLEEIDFQTNQYECFKKNLLQKKYCIYFYRNSSLPP